MAFPKGLEPTPVFIGWGYLLEFACMCDELATCTIVPLKTVKNVERINE